MYSNLVRMGWSLAFVACAFLAIVREFFEALWDELRGCPLASPRRLRPQLEGLGDRIVPAVNYWQAPLGPGAALWSDGGNWSDGVPDSTDDVVFDISHSTRSCTYTGSGGAIAHSITVQAGYPNTLTLNASNTILLDTLTQSDGDINLGTLSSNMEVEVWNFYGGDFNADVPVAAQMKVNNNLDWESSTKDIRVGNKVELPTTGVGVINMTNGKKVQLSNNVNVWNYGTITHKAGLVTAFGGLGNSTNVFENKGTYKKTTAADAKIDWITFKNSDDAAVFSVEAGKIIFNIGSDASTAAFLQTAGTTKVAGGATLETFVVNANDYALDIRGGDFLTTGTTTATIKGETLFQDCTVQLSSDDVTKFGRLENTDSSITFAGSAVYACRIKGDFTGSDLITAKTGIDLALSDTTLVVSVLGDLGTGTLEILKVSDQDAVITGDFLNHMYTADLTHDLTADERGAICCSPPEGRGRLPARGCTERGGPESFPPESDHAHHTHAAGRSSVRQLGPGDLLRRHRGQGAPARPQ